MNEYGAYSILKIESELTWEQVFVLLDAIKERYSSKKTATASQKSGLRKGGNQIVREHDIHDLVEGKAPSSLGIEINREGGSNGERSG